LIPKRKEEKGDPCSAKQRYTLQSREKRARGEDHLVSLIARKKKGMFFVLNEGLHLRRWFENEYHREKGGGREEDIACKMPQPPQSVGTEV